MTHNQNRHIHCLAEIINNDTCRSGIGHSVLICHRTAFIHQHCNCQRFLFTRQPISGEKPAFSIHKQSWFYTSAHQKSGFFPCKGHILKYPLQAFLYLLGNCKQWRCYTLILLYIAFLYLLHTVNDNFYTAVCISQSNMLCLLLHFLCQCQ